MQKYQKQTEREGTGGHVDSCCAPNSESSPWERDFLRHKYLGFVHRALGRLLFLFENVFVFLFPKYSKRQRSALTQWLGKNTGPLLWKRDRRNSSSSFLPLQSALSSASEMWEAAYFSRKPPVT